MARAAKRQRTERSHHATRHGDNQRGSVARHAQLFLEEGGAHLVERNERREGGKRQQRIEHQTYDIAHHRHRRESLLEHVGQRDEDERRTRVGTNAHTEGRRKNHQSRKYGHDGVDDAYLYGRRAEVGLLAVVGGEGADAAHSDAQRVERLSEGSEKDVGRQLREVGLEQKLNAGPGIGQQARADHYHQQQYEQRRHEHLRCLLNAVAHAVAYHEVGHAQNHQRPEDGLVGVG